MKSVLIFTLSLITLGCSKFFVKDPELLTKVEDEIKVICEWGSQKFDLCQYQTQQEMIKALMQEMTLDEKIGQMTQSVWHNNVSPEIMRDKTIGSIIHNPGPTHGPDAKD